MNDENFEQDKALRTAWREEADKQTLETLPAFLASLAEHEHNYNTICYAVACAAVAAAKAINRSPNGGITGFQAGAVMWEFITHWQHLDGKPLRLIDYGDMLYPQYADKFMPIISKETWEWLRDEARKNLRNETQASERVVNHWQQIDDGNVPFGYFVKDLQ